MMNETLLNRRYTRVHFSPMARLTSQGVTYFPCPIRNLSLSGMFALCRFTAPVGTACQVVLTQTGPGSDLSIRAEARVVREDKDGVALEFTSMDYGSYMFLKLLLLYGAEDPHTVSHEYSATRPFLLSRHEPSFHGQREACH
jgi:hypothetical protein